MHLFPTTLYTKRGGKGQVKDGFAGISLGFSFALQNLMNSKGMSCKYSLLAGVGSHRGPEVSTSLSTCG